MRSDSDLEDAAQLVYRIGEILMCDVMDAIGKSRLVRTADDMVLLADSNQFLTEEILGTGAFCEVRSVRFRHGSCGADSDGSSHSSSNTCACGGIGQDKDDLLPPLRRRRLAMKTVRQELLQTSNAQRFRQAAAELAMEAHILASLDHPNILKIRGWAAQGLNAYKQAKSHDAFFLLLDALDETLEQHILTWQEEEENARMTGVRDDEDSQPSTRSGSTSSTLRNLWNLFTRCETPRNDPTPTTKAFDDEQLLEKLNICYEIASALQYLHDEKGIIFRDLKPENIGLLQGHVQLFDFGLSRELPSLDTTEPFQMSGRVGTVRYMAPEVALRQPYTVTADVYSFAMVCYELLTLEKPFDGYNRDSHMQRVCINGERPSTDKIPLPAMRQLLEQCWAQNAKERPTMSQVVQQLELLRERQRAIVSSKKACSSDGSATRMLMMEEGEDDDNDSALSNCISLSDAGAGEEAYEFEFPNNFTLSAPASCETATTTETNVSHRKRRLSRVTAGTVSLSPESSLQSFR